MLSIQDNISVFNKAVNKALDDLSFWLNSNKIALNVAKTEAIPYKRNTKIHDADLKMKLYRKAIHLSPYVK